MTIESKNNIWDSWQNISCPVDIEIHIDYFILLFTIMQSIIGKTVGYMYSRVETNIDILAFICNRTIKLRDKIR